MTVARILADKGHDVVTVEPSLTLREAATLLSGRRIGGAVVMDGGGAVLGIITERDLVRAIGDEGPNVLSESVESRMTRRVVTCRGETAVDDVMALMTSGKFRHVPVVENGKLDGIVSIGDVVKYRLAEIESEHQAMKDYIAAS